MHNRWRAWCCLALLGAACSTAAPELGQGFIVPLGDGTDGSLLVSAYYESILSQMRDAAKDRDEGRLRMLLDQHDREDAPVWAKERMQAFRALLASSWTAERALVAHSRFVLDVPDQPIGESAFVRFEIARLGADAPQVVLGAKGAVNASRFQISVRTIDHGSLGTRNETRSSRIFELEHAVDLAKAELQLRFRTEPGPPDSILREIEVTAELLPGRLQIDGADLPCTLTHCASQTFELWPRGIAAIRAAPLLTLREALRRGDADHFAHVWLAARLLPAADRDAGIALLIDCVRLGLPDQARVAMAALSQIAGASAPPIGDRESWLLWWQRRVPAQEAR